jgi:hypothetical protein
MDSSGARASGADSQSMSGDDWLVCGVVAPSSIILPHDPFSIGAFELARKVDPFPGCGDALQASATAFGEAVDLKRAFLMKTFLLKAGGQATAVVAARAR